MALLAASRAEQEERAEASLLRHALRHCVVREMDACESLWPKAVSFETFQTLFQNIVFQTVYKREWP